MWDLLFKASGLQLWLIAGVLCKVNVALMIKGNCLAVFVGNFENLTWKFNMMLIFVGSWYNINLGLGMPKRQKGANKNANNQAV